MIEQGHRHNNTHSKTYTQRHKQTTTTQHVKGSHENKQTNTKHKNTHITNINKQTNNPNKTRHTDIDILLSITIAISNNNT